MPDSAGLICYGTIDFQHFYLSMLCACCVARPLRSMQVFMLVWSYFAAVCTDPGHVPPGWLPFADEEVKRLLHRTH